MLWREDKAVTARQTEGKLSLPFAFERVRATCDQFANVGSSGKFRQAPLQFLRAVCAEFLLRYRLLLAHFTEFFVVVMDLHGILPRQPPRHTTRPNI